MKTLKRQQLKKAINNIAKNTIANNLDTDVLKNATDICYCTGENLSDFFHVLSVDDDHEDLNMPFRVRDYIKGIYPSYDYFDDLCYNEISNLDDDDMDVVLDVVAVGEILFDNKFGGGGFEIKGMVAHKASEVIGEILIEKYARTI